MTLFPEHQRERIQEFTRGFLHSHKPSRINMYFRPKEQIGLYDSAFEKDSCGVGFVAHIEGKPSRGIVTDAAIVLGNMDHREARGAEQNTGDGAGILTGMPDLFFRRIALEVFNSELPEAGKFAVGVLFLPKDEAQRRQCKNTIEKFCNVENQKIIGWRTLPVKPSESDIGLSALATMPHLEQLFIAAEDNIDQEEFERKLYVIRKRASNVLRRDPKIDKEDLFYICSLSSKTIVYKGMLTCKQLFTYFPDLQDDDYRSHMAMVHSRFSTNTFPSWDRAMPNRCMSHNGEINTIKGNINWMRAREGSLSSDLYGDSISKLFPVIESNCSDSGNFDNVLEFLSLTGRSLQEAILMMIPEAWQNKRNIDPSRKAFYEYQSTIMEPWDGPASITFTNGDLIGAVLDRNGLRPSRYYVTTDQRVIMASEAGVLPIENKNIAYKGRLEPGKIFMLDFKQGKLLSDEKVKNPLIHSQPYQDWVENHRLNLNEITGQDQFKPYPEIELLARMRSFGYTAETLEFMLIPMVHDLRDPLGSMGDDSALAVLSDKPRMLYDYFKQLFAQVSNPAIDSIREKIIMSLKCYIGPEQNLLTVTKRHAKRLLIENPIITNAELAGIKNLDYRGWKTEVIDITFDISPDSTENLEQRLDIICQQAEQAIVNKSSLIVLSDRASNQNRAAISSLMACGAVHHHLVNIAQRTQIGIVLETGEAREVHHFCTLFGYGADAINPYLAYEALIQARNEGYIKHSHHHRGPDNRIPLTNDKAVVDAYRQASVKGILKVMGKMGISTLQSYKGAQIFEAVGLGKEVIEKCFRGTASRISGIGFSVLEEEIARRHRLGWPQANQTVSQVLPNPGNFHWRNSGEKHAWDPENVWSLQYASRINDVNVYEKFSERANAQNEESYTLRGLLSFKTNTRPLDVKKVEPASEIVKRFCTGAMSFGSISAETHETLAIAMNRIGGKSNSGEGGEDPERYTLLPNGDSKSSAIKQIASGRFGVTAAYIANAKQLQIKIAQGAKPGEGGELPGRKVDHKIASIRYSTPGVGLISPPPHHDIYSIEDLSQLIFDLKNANPDAEVSVKLVSEVGVGTIAAGVTKAHADHIVISGEVGGTGASPLTSIKNAGLPWELGIAETHQTLVLNNLRSRVKLQTDGGIKTGRDVVIAGLLGAEEIGFSTAPLIVLGCIMMRKCHLNTCPVGIATQDPLLREKFTGQPEHVINYLFMVAEEARAIMANLGFQTFDELIGRVDVLEANAAIDHWKADGLDLSPLLTPATELRDNVDIRQTIQQEHGIERVLDHLLIEKCSQTLKSKEQTSIDLPIVNTNRTTGAMLSHEVVKRWGEDGLADGTIKINFEGSAGQSFGAFLATGIRLKLTGDSNDYLGKGLSGGRIVVVPPEDRIFKAEDNILIGNVALYGATSGSAFFRGRAAERFCVRNSGANAVVEGIGDHGCEYMTGGRVVVLGDTGINFAAGMSGGIAYVFDQYQDFVPKCNPAMVELEAVEDEARIAELFRLIKMHLRYTGSDVAQSVLDDWPDILTKFFQVMPIDYKRVLVERTEHNEEIESIFDTK